MRETAASERDYRWVIYIGIPSVGAWFGGGSGPEVSRWWAGSGPLPAHFLGRPYFGSFTTDACRWGQLMHLLCTSLLALTFLQSFSIAVEVVDALPSTNSTRGFRGAPLSM